MILQRYRILLILLTIVLAMCACSSADAEEIPLMDDTASQVLDQQSQDSIISSSRDEEIPEPSSSSVAQSSAPSAPERAEPEPSSAPESKPEESIPPPETSPTPTVNVDEDFETYLRNNLPKDAYGGLYLRSYHNPESIKAHIWVVDQAVVEAVVNDYPSNKLEVVYQPTECSVAALETLRDRILSMNKIEDRIDFVEVQDIDNRVEVYLRHLTQDSYYSAIETIIIRSEISEYVEIFATSYNSNAK